MTTGAPLSSWLERVPPPRTGSWKSGAGLPCFARGRCVAANPTARKATNRAGTTTKAASRRDARTLGAEPGSDRLLVARLRFFSEARHLGAQLGHLGILDGRVGLLVGSR